MSLQTEFHALRAEENRYVAASCIAEISQRVALLYVLGWDGLAQWRTWNAPLWLQFGIPVVMVSFKAGYLIGAFGEDKVVEGAEKMGRVEGKVGRKDRKEL